MFLYLESKETYDYFSLASCITYDDILFNELHDINVRIGDVVHIKYSDDKEDFITIIDIEKDGTIWVSID